MKDINAYDELAALQKMNNAFDEWRTYRKNLTEFILSNTSKNKNIAIFGSGRCNDLDLNILVKEYSTIYLYDKDLTAVNEGIKKYELIGNNKIKVVESDFLGITEKDYRQFADQLFRFVKSHSNIYEIVEFVFKKIRVLYDKANLHTVDFGNKIFDNSVIIGVHSQLNSMIEWIWTSILQVINKTDCRVLNKIHEMNQNYVNKLNDAIINATIDNLIIGCEKEIIGKKVAIEGAYQNEIDISERLKLGSLEIISETNMLWPFDKSQSLEYNMKISSIKLL